MDRIYLDNAATTRLSRRAMAVMLAFLEEEGGNPSSLHAFARRERKALESAREQVAACLGAAGEEIYFTASGSESNNFLLSGFLQNQKQGCHVITSAIEHPSVLNTLRFWENRGLIDLSVLPVDKNGQVLPEEVGKAIRETTVLVSIMAANNEVGTIEPISAIGCVCRKRGVILHCDGVQAAGHIPLRVGEMGVDMLTISGHKFHGPRGIGAAFVRRGLMLTPLIHGGEQEHHMRAGTENVAGALGMAEALQEAVERMDEDAMRLGRQQKKMLDAILNADLGARLTGHPTQRLPGIVSFIWDGISADELLALLDMEGVAASAGSACTAGSHEPSHVLSAMGLLTGAKQAPLRLSLSRYTMDEEIDRVIHILPSVVQRLRG